MSLSPAVTAGILTLLAVAHSYAGETGFIRPLVRAEWTIDEVPRWAANRLLRIAWHLTSVAWLALAVIAIGGTPVTAVSVASLLSGLMMFIGLRGHPAWPAFLLAGAFGLHGEGLLGSAVMAIAAGLAVLTAVALAGLHLYWVAGGRCLLDAAVPTTVEGTRTFTPGPIATLSVACLLTGFAGLVAVVAAYDEAAPLRWLLLAGVAILAARAVGDGRHAGFTKQNRATRFADFDDRFFTPIAVFLAMGATAATLV